jgi:glucose/mannose transport system permease protein
MKGKGWERWVAVLMVLPSILLIGVFVYGFIGWTVYISMSNWVTAAPDFSFVGLANYEKLLFSGGIESQRFFIDIRNLFGFGILVVGACVIIGFGLALLLDSRIPGENIFRSIYLMPFALSAVVAGVVWRWLLTPGTEQLGRTGINKLFESIGLGFIRPRWFIDPTVWHIHKDSGLGQVLTEIGLGPLASSNVGLSVGTISVALAATWLFSGAIMALYLAGIRGIPNELREAAVIDGANFIQIVRYVYLPLLRPVTFSAIILVGGFALRLYDLTVAMTGKGPGFSTDTLAYNMFETTFRSTNFAQGAVLATVLMLLFCAIIIPYLVYVLRSETAS